MIPVRKLRLLATAAAGLAGLSLAGAAHAAPSRDGQAALDAFAAHLGYRYAVLDNRAAPNAFSSELDLSLPDAPLPQGWSLYFGMVNAVKAMDSDAFRPTPGRRGLYCRDPEFRQAA